MPWSGGSFTRTNGVNTGSTLWVQDRDDGTKILATRHDTNDQDMADGINSTLEKSGSNAATGNLNIGSNRLTAVADGTAKTDAATVNQIVSNAPAFQATDTGTANAHVIALSPAITAYAAGQEITFKSGAASTGASTLNVNTLGVKALKKLHDQDIASGDIESGSIVAAVYDGTNFQVTSQLASASTTSPGGSNTQVQYNSSSAFAGSANFTFDGTNVDIAGDITGSTLNADGDTAAGDNSALGYTSVLGAILTGQGSTNDVTLVNDADATVLGVPTGTTNVTIVGSADAAGLSLNNAKLQSMVFEIGNVGGTIKHRWLSPNMGVTELGNWGEKFLNATTTSTTTPTGTDSSTAFAGGAKLRSGDVNTIIFDMAAQTTANALLSSATVFQNNTGTAGLLAGASTQSRDVNGTTRQRWEVGMTDEDEAVFLLNTTNMASGKRIRMLITGWFA